MKIYQKFLSKLYIKKFLLLFIAFEIFFTGINLLQNLKHVPPSANLQILYAVNKFFEFVNYTLPLSLIFALLTSMLQIIKSNELISLYALGISKTDILKPFLYISTFISILYVGLNTLPEFVQTYDVAKAIKKRGTVSQISSSIFIKSNNTYAYIEQLNPHEKTGKNLKIFITKDKDLVEIIEAKRGYFTGNHWELQDIIAYEKPNLHDSKDPKLIAKEYQTRNVLYGFTPRIIDTLFKSTTHLTIQDSFAALGLFKTQNIKTNKIRANIYWLMIFPFFAPIMIFGLFFLLPDHQRDANLTLVSTVVIFAILTIWGLLFTMTKIANNGSLSPELGIVLPILLLLATSIYIAIKQRK